MNFGKEILAGISILAPSIVALTTKWPNLKTKIAAAGCILHAPFSIALHIHRAFGTPRTTIRTLLYRLDVSFINLHSFLQGTSWNLRPKTPIATGAIILWIWTAKPTEANKRLTDWMTAIAVLTNARDLAKRSALLATITLLVWVAGFAIYFTKFGGEAESSIIFHILLAIPQHCLLRGINLPIYTALNRGQPPKTGEAPHQVPAYSP